MKDKESIKTNLVPAIRFLPSDTYKEEETNSRYRLNDSLIYPFLFLVDVKQKMSETTSLVTVYVIPSRSFMQTRRYRKERETRWKLYWKNRL